MSDNKLIQCGCDPKKLPIYGNHNSMLCKMRQNDQAIEDWKKHQVFQIDTATMGSKVPIWVNPTRAANQARLDEKKKKVQDTWGTYLTPSLPSQTHYHYPDEDEKYRNQLF